MKDLSNEIYQKAIDCGFDKCGIVPISSLDGFKALYEKRVKDVPDSKNFYSGVKALEETKSRFPWAKSIVILVFDYGKFRFPKELQGKYGKAFFLEPEAGSADRFDLKKLEQWFRDNDVKAEGGEQFGSSSIGPLRYIAMQAGLGIIRKNNFFYTEKGSYNNLYGYVIDKEYKLINQPNLVPCSQKCDLCQRACKTGALSAPYTMNPLRCVSFLTTFGNCVTPEGLLDEMYEQWVCGCDNCQDACPHNKRHDWHVGKQIPELEEIADAILPDCYDELTDDFLIRKVIPKTANHLKEKDVEALRKNAMRSLNNKVNRSD